MSDLAQHDAATALADFNVAKEAIFQSQLDVLDEWLGKTPDLRATDDKNKTLLFHAVADGKHAAAEMLLQKGADPNLGISAPYRTLLETAINNSDKPMVELLLKHKARVNEQDRDGDTPLHHAAWIYNRDIVMILLDHGADVTIKDNKRNTPADSARYRQSIDPPFKPQLDAVIKLLEEIEEKKKAEQEVQATKAAEDAFIQNNQLFRSVGQRFKMKI